MSGPASGREAAAWEQPGQFSKPPKNAEECQGGEDPSEKRSAARKELYELRDWYRTRSKSDRVRACGRTRVQAEGADLRVTEHETGRRSASWSGVRLCESPWSCAVCGATVRKRRAAALRELQKWVTANGFGCALITLTLRHKRRDDLRAMRLGIARCWARIQRGNTWRLLSGLMERNDPEIGPAGPVDVGYFRVLEVTYGDNGWHVHYHVLCITDRPLVQRFNLETGALQCEAMDIQKGLTKEWRRAVGLELGVHHVPSNERAVRVDRYTAMEYASKLDLEMTDSSDAKKAAAGGLKPFELLRLAMSGKEHTIETNDGQRYTITAERALYLFQVYESAMHGARLHTATQGMIAWWESRIPKGNPVGTLVVEAKTFDALRDVPGALAALTTAVETSNILESAREAVAALGQVWLPRGGKWCDKRKGWTGEMFDGPAAAKGLVFKP